MGHTALSLDEFERAEVMKNVFSDYRVINLHLSSGKISRKSPNI